MPARLYPRPARRRPAALAAAAAVIAVVCFGVAQPAGARPEPLPHSGDWDGFDLYVNPLIEGKHGLRVQTFSHGADYCIPLSHGWNAIPLQHWTRSGSGAKLIVVNNCRQGYLLPKLTWQASPGEVWYLEGASVYEGHRAS
ncbi:hypothetical protein BFL35_13430 [Clavibacter michiganensis]|nr:hypothetical protein BFL35_13430 [Clavibacter michiganensis]